MKIVVGATAAGHKQREASRWLIHAGSMQAITPHDIRFFLVAEVQPSGLEPRLDAIAAQVKALGGEVWKFMIDDRSDQITNATRMIRICEGRNLITEFALRERADWILYVDADIIIPPDVINKLLQIGQKFCGFNVPSYCLSGEVVPGFDFPVQIYQNTAGAWFLHRSVFRFFRWLWDPDDGLTDDPATYRIIRDHLGLVQYNRLDVCGEHTPLIPFESRRIDAAVQRHLLDGHPITAVIPVYFAAAQHIEMTASILQKVLNEPVSRVYVLYNGGEMPYCAQGTDVLERYSVKECDRIKIVPVPGETVYQLWNIGWRKSLEDFGDEVLIVFLDNDIDFLPGTLEMLAKAVLPNEIGVAYPDPTCRVQDGIRLTGRTIATRGTKRHGGMTGHCFLIKGGIHTKSGFPLFDSHYYCWYGDDDFAFRIDQYGYQIHRVEGLPCDHLNEATMQYRLDLMEKREQDRQRFIEKWGDI